MRTEAKDQSAAKRLGAQADKVDPAGPPNRGAFTLVELLVVIGILGVLAALITPAVFQARVSARNAAIKAEIDMLHMAIMNYKNEYGSFPPCSSVASASSPAAKHVNRLFPRSSGAGDTSVRSPENALVRWLRGYSSDPTDPFGAGRKKMFDFDESRVTSVDEYHPTGKPGSQYIYIDSANYGTPFGVYQSVAGFNNDTFQILCAGLDGIWSEDANLNGVLDSGEDLNSNGVLDISEDDLSNFWKGTRQDYLDSLE